MSSGTCINCGSHAINHHMHGRDGTLKNFCDVCFWRVRADSMKAIIDEMESRIEGRANEIKKNKGFEMKLWLWKNFVNGKPEYWAFDNPFSLNINNDDPQVIGEPCGYAIFKPSRTGRTDISEDEVLRRIKISAVKVLK